MMTYFLMLKGDNHKTDDNNKKKKKMDKFRNR